MIGDYMWNLFVEQKNSKGKGKTLCFPSGFERDGWATARLNIIGLFNQGNQGGEDIERQREAHFVQRTMATKPIQELPFSGVAGRDWLEPVVEEYNNKQANYLVKTPRVVVESRCGLMNCSWWRIVVICTPSKRLDSWSVW
ncbi:hypothetical protein FRX31_023188 [Thalictrum thalictroides]|uniref:Uncharacterized protein n=1 Tax=Thalictrum thalictroides TaxID=46969 RepID=A0A7J6VQ47_THATH|nr:hypothetical protein FRX31_023188 [Thalictrum thalictroides]